MFKVFFEKNLIPNTYPKVRLTASESNANEKRLDYQYTF